jgi:hypothetical protein
VPARPVLNGSEYVGRDEANRWRDTVSHALADHYGRWACGWCWGLGESDHDGGPVSAWCCVVHSIEGPDETLARVADSLVEWRTWLAGLAGRFEHFLTLLDGPGDDFGVVWEFAVHQLIVATVDRTRCESGWHGHCMQVLGWFLTAAGIPRERHDALIDDAIGGRFRSWVVPSTADITAIAERLAQDVAGAEPPPDDWPDTWPQDWPAPRATNLPAVDAAPSRRRVPATPGALTAWRAVRTEVDWAGLTQPVSGPVTSGRDGIAEHYARRGVDRMLPALDLVRADAAKAGPLTFARLASWQRVVLDVPEAPFRSGSAFAKRGREWYAWWPELPDVFDECLAEASDLAVPLPSRAARVYLDVAFFHPFDDGNARAAALALAYTLAREGVVLDRAAPILVTSWSAHDAAGAAILAGLVETLINASMA